MRKRRARKRGTYLPITENPAASAATGSGCRSLCDGGSSYAERNADGKNCGQLSKQNNHCSPPRVSAVAVIRDLPDDDPGRCFPAGVLNRTLGGNGGTLKTPGVECAPGGGQDERFGLTIVLGFQRMKAMTKHRSHSV